MTRDPNFTIHALEGKPSLIHLCFEQGRGKTGMPKCWISYPGTDTKLETLIAVGVATFRAHCIDGVIGHGQDLMPPELEDVGYELHLPLGGRIDKIEDIRWEARADGIRVADLVLTWGLPSEHLAQTRQRL